MHDPARTRWSSTRFRDFGSTTLGIGIVLAAAGLWLERRLVVVPLGLLAVAGTAPARRTVT